MSPPLCLPDVFCGREAGFVSRCNYEQYLIHHRLTCLSLSSCRTLQVSVHSSGITDLDVDTCESRYALAGAANGTLYIHDLWDTRAAGRPQFTAEVVAHVGKSHRHAHKFSIECVQWYPQDHGLFLTSGMDKCLKVWDTNMLTPADQFQFVGKIHSHHMSHIGGHHLIAVATNVNHVHLIDIKSGANTHELRGHQGQVLSCQWSNRDSNLLATGSSDKKIYLWDVRNARKRLKCLDYNHIRGQEASKVPASEGLSHDGSVNGLKFSDHGLNLISFGRDGRVRVWDVASGRNLKCKFPRFLNKTKSYVKFDVCGDIMAIPSQSVIYNLNMRDDSVVQELSGHYMNVNTCVFRPDAQELLSGGDDRNVLIWDPNDRSNKAYQEHLQAKRSVSDNMLKVTTVDQSQPSTIDTWSDDESGDSN